MSVKNKSLGIDIGSVSIAIAIIDHNKKIVFTAYAFHKGQIFASLNRLLHGINISEINAIGSTSSSASSIALGVSVDTRVAYISAAKYFHPDVQSL